MLGLELEPLATEFAEDTPERDVISIARGKQVTAGAAPLGPPLQMSLVRQVIGLAAFHCALLRM